MASAAAADAKRMRAAEEGKDIEVAIADAPRAMPQIPQLGNPTPIGLISFGMTTMMLMFIITTWAEAAFANTFLCYAMFLGGFVLSLSGVFEMIKGNTFAATAFLGYGAFWLGLFLQFYITTNFPQNFTGASETGTTLFYCLWGLFTICLFIPTLRTNWCLVTVFALLTAMFFLLAGGVHNVRCNKAAGYFGFFTGLSAMYAGVAILYVDMLGVTLPGLQAVKFI